MHNTGSKEPKNEVNIYHEQDGYRTRGNAADLAPTGLMSQAEIDA